MSLVRTGSGNRPASLWYLPLEGLETRYTQGLDRELRSAFRRRRIPYFAIRPRDVAVAEPRRGHFLDPATSCEYKAAQLRELMQADLKGGDVVFVSDLQFPGIELVKFLAAMRNIDVKIVGLMHAGSWTPSDTVASFGPWMGRAEIAWVMACEEVYVGSHFHREQMAWHFLNLGLDGLGARVHVTGLPFDMLEIQAVRAERKEWEGKRREKKVGPDEAVDVSGLYPRVVHTGRLHPEKRHDIFNAVVACIVGTKRLNRPDIEFVNTHEIDPMLAKHDYLHLLASSAVWFSAAEQENYGYAALEAAAMGARCIVPDALAYRETFPRSWRYEPGNVEEAARLVVDAVNGRVAPHDFDINWYAQSADRIADRVGRLLHV